MDYYRVLNFHREPFSNSPDPEVFYRAREHADCLQKLELSIRTRRGLAVVIGAVGTGKTTLCRHLLRNLGDDPTIESHLILDPSFSTPTEFLLHIGELFTLPVNGSMSDWQIKEKIKDFLFAKGVEEGKIVLILVDEGQKAPTFCLELLREFLNYETNDHKLLQIGIFAQKEFLGTLDDLQNFADRISLYHELGPLSFQETKSLIKYRLSLAAGEEFKVPRFSQLAYWLIHRTTGGYPRKIMNLCHQILLALIIQNKTSVGARLVLTSAERIYPAEVSHIRRKGTLLVGAAALAIVAALLLAFTSLPNLFGERGFGLAGVANETITTNADSAESTGTDQIGAALIDAESKTEATTSPGLFTGLPAVPEEVTQAAPAGMVELPELVAARSLAPATTVSSGQGNVAVATKTIEVGGNPTSLESRGPISLPDALSQYPFTSAMLGSVEIGEGETISDLVRHIYGPGISPTGEFVRRILAANPQIGDPNFIVVGDKILFPNLKREQETVHDMKVRLVAFDDLQSAKDYLKTNKNTLPRMLLEPASTEDGRDFLAVVLEEQFKSAQMANVRISQLPLTVADGAVIVESLRNR